MRKPYHYKPGFILLLLMPFFQLSGQEQQDSIIFLCQPCDMYCDTIPHTAPGTCEVCGMPFFAAYASMMLDDRTTGNTLDKTVAILLFPGVEIIDFAGPHEVFEAAGARVITVAESTDILTAGSSLKIKPDHTFADMPEADIIVLPGGNVRRSDPEILEWIKRQDKSAEKILSVCNGALFLSTAGLLDGLDATTFFPLIPSLQALSPNTNVVDDQRYVNNGHIITSAGLSSGIDAALFVVSEYLGVGGAQQLATSLEYNWNYDHGYVRAQLADKYFVRVLDVFSSFPRKITKYSGDRDQWQIEVEIQTPLSIEQLNSLISAQLERVNQWQLTRSGSGSSQWTFAGADENWNGSVLIENKSDEENAWYITLKVWK